MINIIEELEKRNVPKCRKTRANTVNIFVFVSAIIIFMIIASVVTSTYVAESRLKEDTRQAWRSQARQTLSTIRSKFMHDYELGIVDPGDDWSLLEWSKNNLSTVRNGGPTSDGFMIELGREIFINDDSPDCSKGFVVFKRTMSDESALHNNPALAEKVLTEMRQAYSTSFGDNNYWLFDTSPELLEWVIIPEDKVGFNNEPMIIGGVKNPLYTGLLVQLGTQEDEILKPYKDVFENLRNLRGLLYILGTLAVFQPIGYMVYFIYQLGKCPNFSSGNCLNKN